MIEIILAIFVIVIVGFYRIPGTKLDKLETKQRLSCYEQRKRE